MNDGADDRPEEVALLGPRARFAQHYEITGRIKVGGMGAVYRAVDLRTRRTRALKVLLGGVERDMRARFESEATITSQVKSEHLVEILDAGVDEATHAPYLAMELCDGPDLGVMLAERGRFEAAEAAALLAQLGLALDRIHAASIVHRDLKPENVIVTRREDGRPLVKLLDFGVAKLADATLDPKTTRAVGTPAYMAPEQIDGHGAIGPEADIYAFGHLTFTLLVGEAYWARELAAGGRVYAILVQVMRGSTEAASARARRHGVELPAAFDAWFAKATARDPADRFASASAAAAALPEALTGRLRARRPGWGAALLVSALAAVGVASWASGRSGAASSVSGAATSVSGAATSVSGAATSVSEAATSVSGAASSAPAAASNAPAPATGSIASASPPVRARAARRDPPPVASTAAPPPAVTPAPARVELADPSDVRR